MDYAKSKDPFALRSAERLGDGLFLDRFLENYEREIVVPSRIPLEAGDIGNHLFSE